MLLQTISIQKISNKRTAFKDFKKESTGFSKNIEVQIPVSQRPIMIDNYFCIKSEHIFFVSKLNDSAKIVSVLFMFYCMQLIISKILEVI